MYVGLLNKTVSMWPDWHPMNTRFQNNQGKLHHGSYKVNVSRSAKLKYYKTLLPYRLRLKFKTEK